MVLDEGLIVWNKQTNKRDRNTQIPLLEEIPSTNYSGKLMQKKVGRNWGRTAFLIQVSSREFELSLPSAIGHANWGSQKVVIQRYLEAICLLKAVIRKKTAILLPASVTKSEGGSQALINKTGNSKLSLVFHTLINSTQRVASHPTFVLM